MKPAWSWQFEAGKLAPATPLSLPSPITADWAWGGSTGAGVRVAVVDSGIDAAHPAVGTVAGGVALHYDPEAPGQVRAVEGPHEDLFGHGTACAGIIRTLASGAELYSVRVLGARLTGKGLVFAAGLRWAIDHRMQVVNLSLSTGKRDYFAVFHELVDEAYFAKVMLVCAVNNVAGPTYPSQYAAVFSVAANEATDPTASTTTRPRRSSSAPPASTSRSPGWAVRPSRPPATASPPPTSPAWSPASSASTPA